MERTNNSGQLVAFMMEDWVRWQVFFLQSDLNHWLFRFLRTGFTHCLCVRYDIITDAWIIVNGRYSRIEIDTVPLSSYPDIEDYIQEVDGPITAKCIIDVEVDRSQAIQQLSILSCVDVVKMCLGINSWYTLTPYQLYRSLINVKFREESS